MALNKFQGELAVYGRVAQLDLTMTLAADNLEVQSTSVLVNGVDIVEDDFGDVASLLSSLPGAAVVALDLPDTAEATDEPQQTYRGDFVLYMHVEAIDVDEPLDMVNLVTKVDRLTVNGKALGAATLATIDFTAAKSYARRLRQLPGNSELE